MNLMKLTGRFRIGILLFVVGALSIQCQKITEPSVGEPLKVDFDFSGRKIAEVHHQEYESWVVEPGTGMAKDFGDIHFKINGNITSGWYKTGVRGSEDGKLIADGIQAKDSLVLMIRGLAKGKHSLLTFHNTFDNPKSRSFSPVNIYVNDELVETIEPTTREVITTNSAMSYITFEAQDDQEVTLRFEVADTNENTDLVINGFELDLPNKMMQANNPDPANNDEHVEVKEGFGLYWELPEGASSSEVYFGLNEEAVATANLDDEEYLGETSNNSYKVEDLYSMNTYYWRVDIKNDDGERTRGSVWSFRPAQLAFPGAEGYGRYALGGRGGKVVEVTNLNDSGPGSLREAVTNDIGPRTIVFNVSGNIELESRLVVNQPYITIAGQTAPGKGITISRAPVGLTGDDGVIRFIRVRIGAGRTYDGMGLTGANHSIIDHSSISWTLDEGFSSRGAHNITLQRTLISEALNIAGHTKYGKGAMHGYAATIGGDVGSFHHNLLAHNYGRNWSMGGGLNGNGYYTGRLDIRNNVVYNWGKRTTDGGAHEVNFVNNYYKPGPATELFYALTMQHEGVGRGSQRAHFSGNIMPGHFNLENQEKGRRSVITNNENVEFETFVDEPFFPSHIETESARLAYKTVLSDVGSNQPLDEHDKRMIQETLDGTFKYRGSVSGLPGMIDTHTDSGGWEDYPEETRPETWDTDHDGLPNWWEEAKGLNTDSAIGDFSDTNSDEDRDGFTQLDEYLDWMAKPNFFISEGENLEISAAELFRGFTSNPQYSVSEVQNGKVSINLGNIQFRPEAKGLASFELKVKDSEGDAMTRKVNVLVQ